MKQSQGIRHWLLVLASMAFLPNVVWAGTGSDIVALASQIEAQAQAIAQLLTIASYVAGVGFALAGILQFKAHKENPQQMPLGKPVVMIVVSGCLLFLPTVLTIAGGSLFGSDAQSAASGLSGS